ncbi:stromelysin-3-like [Sitophilus oryzae]|uniref:Stromelysin-3-like n=1 Tax=Sitophilus oryzae TaxID=7048 RepID=A0A6J2Y648_SITOR|nr:stromelysin-3-like [Sitophilus oryzae]
MFKLFKQIRCGVEDIVSGGRTKRYVTTKGWNKRNLTYYISNWSSKLNEDTVASNIQKALDIWGSYGRLTFTRSNSQYADIIVSFASGYHGDSYPFDGPGLVLAHAFFPYRYEEVGIDGDIHFDNDEDWADRANNVGNPEGTDFFTVALHELGHSLGLAHSTVPTSVMFPYYKGYEPGAQTYLDYDDIIGMYQLYIARSIPDSGIPSNDIPDREPVTERTTTRRYPYQTTTQTPWWITGTTRRHDWHHPRHPTTTESPYWTTETSKEVTVSYHGDSESVDEHKEHDPTHHIPKDNSPSLPYICNGYLDAVATLRGELFVFKDEYLWRFRDMRRLEPGYPTKTREMFPELPEDIKKIDAAYQRTDGSIVLFTGNQYWVSDGSRFIENSPLPLSNYGLPDYLDSIDAVQLWAKNGKTYFYKNDRFWRYNELTKTMDEGYPMHMERWRGVPQNLDAATTWKDGNTYFFKNELFWKFDNDWIIATETSPFPIGPIWFGCEEENNMMRLFGNN